MKLIHFSSIGSRAHPLEGSSSREASSRGVTAASLLAPAVAPAPCWLWVPRSQELSPLPGTFRSDSLISAGNLLLWQLKDLGVNDVLHRHLMQVVFPSAPPVVSPILSVGQAGAAGLCSLGPLAQVLISSRRTTRSSKPPLGGAGAGVQGVPLHHQPLGVPGCLSCCLPPTSLLSLVLSSSLETGGEMTPSQGSRNDLTANYAEESFSCACA